MDHGTDNKLYFGNFSALLMQNSRKWSHIHGPTPQSCYRPKSPIHLRRDRERMEQHKNLSAEKIGQQNNYRPYKTIPQSSKCQLDL